MICPNKHEPGVECADCRGFAAVWERLGDFTAPEVSLRDSTRARTRASRRKRPSARGGVGWLWRPITPRTGDAAAVMALVMFVHVPIPRGTDTAKQVSTPDIEQVAQAVDDLDLLIPIAK